MHPQFKPTGMQLPDHVVHLLADEAAYGTMLQRTCDQIPKFVTAINRGSSSIPEESILLS